MAVSMTGREVDKLFGIVYEELRRLARTVKLNDPCATLSPTALVHEAWLKLQGSSRISIESPLHFKRIATRAMRQVLVEAARRRNADKRGGIAPLVELGPGLAQATSSAEDIVALNHAISELEKLDPRRAAGVEARFFGGFTAAEISEMLDISEETVLADWRGARAWLAHQLRKG